MRFKRKLLTSISYNATLRKETPNDKIYAAVTYEPPLPIAPVVNTDGTPTITATSSSIGSSGLWTFAEVQESDGSRFLNLKYREQQVHTFLVSE